jgi:DNA-binding beta-propeller fold protein YncE
MRLLTAVLLTTGSIAPASAAVIRATEVFATPAIETSEIPAYDARGNRIFVAAGSNVEVINARSGVRTGTVTLPAGLGTVNSVAVSGNRLAIAVDAATATDPGTVLIYNTANLGAPLRTVQVGAVPDNVVFTPDGRRLLVANEGEPSSYGRTNSVDPEGSISVINVASGTVQTAGFAAFNDLAAMLRGQGVRIFGPGASVAQDLEPEYIAVAPDGTAAFVTLQENNALAVIDLTGATPAVERIVPLGYKNFGATGNGLDPSDEDGIKGNIQTVPGLYGAYQPDAIAAFEVGGKTYVVTANEGDAREYDGFEEEVRAGDLGAQGPIERLNVTSEVGAAVPNDAQFVAFGGRSFSIRNAATGELVYDSGDFIERLLADRRPDLLDDGRSDSKGPEPEEIELGLVDGRLILFVGLERANQETGGTILTFDLSAFVPGVSAPDFLGFITSASLGGPEGLAFFSNELGSFLAVADEITNQTVLFRVDFVPEPGALGLLGLGLLGAARLRRLPAKSIRNGWRLRS